MPATLSLGASGDDVKRLQRVLARMLLYNPFGPITGIFDSTLQGSVIAFQQGAGLTPDGIVGPLTWAALPAYREASPTVQHGSLGPTVAWLQKTLSGSVVAVNFSPYSGAIDGIFGPQTKSAVQALQAWANLPSTGIVDDDVWFTWMTPGTAQQLTLERASNLLNGL